MNPLSPPGRRLRHQNGTCPECYLRIQNRMPIITISGATKNGFWSTFAIMDPSGVIMIQFGRRNANVRRISGRT